MDEETGDTSQKTECEVSDGEPNPSFPSKPLVDVGEPSISSSKPLVDVGEPSSLFPPEMLVDVGEPSPSFPPDMLVEVEASPIFQTKPWVDVGEPSPSFPPEMLVEVEPSSVFQTKLLVDVGEPNLSFPPEMLVEVEPSSVFQTKHLVDIGEPSPSLPPKMLVGDIQTSPVFQTQLLVDVGEPSPSFPSEPLAAAPLSVHDTNVALTVMEKKYVLAIDIGTSSVRGHVYDTSAHLKGTASIQHQILQPEPGWCEIDPQRLFQDVCIVAQDSIKAAGLQPDQIACMGITTMRSSFVTWDRETGEPFHNLITWQDLRAVDYVSQWNKSYRLFTLNMRSKFLYKLFGKKQHLAASVLKFMSKQVTMKLLWVFDSIPEVRVRASQNQVMFGCAETWVLWKLTQGKSHVTDFSCASATGLFDPFQMEWSSIVCGLLNIPMSMFPEVKDTSGDFGVTDPDVFGCKIPITAVVADQQGAMFGHCCFDLGDVKCTMGTGTFLDVNTGSRPHASVAGLYPIIGWKIGSELVFLAEGQSADTGIAIEWARTLGLFDDLADSSDLAESVPDSGGVFFVPAFSGLQAPYNDDKAATAMFGMTPNTTKAHLVRAVLESLVFRFKSLFETALGEIRIPLSHVRVDGDVAANNFLVQMMSDIVDRVIERSLHSDMSCLGTAFLAGLAKGVWASKEDLKALRQSDRQFEPRHSGAELKRLYHNWGNAVHRSQNWYPPS